MRKEDCVEIGYISKSHGLKGELKLVLDVHDPAEYEGVRTIYVAKKDEALQKMHMKSLKQGPGRFYLAAFTGVNSRDASDALVGATLFFPVERLPKLGEGHFYYFQVIGFEVQDELLGKLGIVRDFWETNAKDILVMDYQGKEVLVPMNEEIVLSADFSNRLVFTRLPEGLLELYLGA